MCFIGVNQGRRSSKGRSEIEREESSLVSGFSGVEEERRSAEIKGEDSCYKHFKTGRAVKPEGCKT